jgi:hypothetical protein
LNDPKEVKEVDLIKVKTIKRKHVEQLLEPVGTAETTHLDDCEFRYYIGA